MCEIISCAVHDQIIRQQNIQLRSRRKLRLHRCERTRKILLITIQPRQHLARSPCKPTIQRIVNPIVLLHKKLRSRVPAHPFLQLQPSARVLNHMLHLHTLIPDRAHAKPQPVGLTEARSNNRKTHPSNIPNRSPDEHTKIADWTPRTKS